MMKSQHDIKNEDGSTLVETLVAMAILVSVLLPAGMFLGYMANTPQNEEKIIALGLAQSEMEQVLDSGNYKNAEREIDNKWLIRNTIAKEDNLLQISVSVYRKNKSKPILKLITERLVYDH